MHRNQALNPAHGRGLRLLLAVLVVALSLRGAITCVGPLLETIQRELNLSGTAAGLLASLPLFAFGFISPYAAPLARRVGIEVAVFLSLLLIVAGLGIRYLPGTLELYLGTALIGTGIAISNVLLPGLLRRDFPRHLATVTALFTMVLVTFGGLGSGVAIPLAEWGGWRFSLLAWLLPAVLGIMAWIPCLRHNSRPPAHPEGNPALWGIPVAWQVSLFMGCQSTAFYVMIAWFPSIMSDLQGVSPARSGFILFVYQIFVLLAVMAVPWLVHRLPDQRWIGTGCAALILAGYAGLLLATDYALLWMILMGLGAGASLVLAMTLFGLRVSSASQAVALSGMAQTVGYLMAALAPILIGFIHDATGAWTVPLALMNLLALLQGVVGYLAGRPVTIRSAGTFKTERYS